MALTSIAVAVVRRGPRFAPLQGRRGGRGRALPTGRRTATPMRGRKTPMRRWERSTTDRRWKVAAAELRLQRRRPRGAEGRGRRGRADRRGGRRRRRKGGES